jgi:hypothetical protein
VNFQKLKNFAGGGNKSIYTACSRRVSRIRVNESEKADVVPGYRAAPVRVNRLTQN